MIFSDGRSASWAGNRLPFGKLGLVRYNVTLEEEEAQPSMHPTRATHERRIPTTSAQARSRAARGTALSLALALAGLGAAAGAAQANTLNGPTVSSGARATVPMTVSVSGSADPTAALRVYVQPSGIPCASSSTVPTQGAPGAAEVISQEPVGAFSYSGMYTPPAAGAYTVCAYLFGVSSNTGTSAASTSFVAGPAPPPPPPGSTNPSGPGATGTAPAAERCIVPKLKGRTYLGARTRLRRAGCNVGTVFRPGRATSRRLRAQGRVLRVVTQYPKPRSVKKAGFRVMLRLAYVKRARS